MSFAHQPFLGFTQTMAVHLFSGLSKDMSILTDRFGPAVWLRIHRRSFTMLSLLAGCARSLFSWKSSRYNAETCRLVLQSLASATLLQASLKSALPPRKTTWSASTATRRSVSGSQPCSPSTLLMLTCTTSDSNTGRTSTYHQVALPCPGQEGAREQAARDRTDCHFRHHVSRSRCRRARCTSGTSQGRRLM